MEIKIGEKNGKKTPIYIDGELLGSLYPKEVSDYALKDDGEISEDVYQRIIEETLLPRAKRYVMNLLVKSDKTEAELKRKLKQAGYGETISDGAIEYVRSFHYIDELRTAESFIRTKMDFSSEKEIRYKLSEKGISEETIDMAYEQVLEELNPDERSDEKDGFPGENKTYGVTEVDEYLLWNTEIKAALNFVRKKLGSKLGFCIGVCSDTDGSDDAESDGCIISYEEKQKLMAAAFRKGFKQESIRQALKMLGIDG